jgi:hypothetical protein
VTFSRIALGGIAVLLLGAEIVRPTQWTAKKISRTSLAANSGAPFDREALDDLPPIVTPALGNIDKALVVANGRDIALELYGWCADPETRATAPTLLAIVDGRRRIDETAGYDRARADVASYLKAPGMNDAGFFIRLSGAELGPGPHTVRVAVVASDRRGIFVFPTPETVTVPAQGAVRAP